PHPPNLGVRHDLTHHRRRGKSNCQNRSHLTTASAAATLPASSPRPANHSAFFSFFCRTWNPALNRACTSSCPSKSPSTTIVFDFGFAVLLFTPFTLPTASWIASSQPP